MNQFEIPREHDRKPDSDDPWRYVCPSCERQVFGHERSTRYHCSHCGTGYDKLELKDLKGRIHD